MFLKEACDCRWRRAYLVQVLLKGGKFIVGQADTGGWQGRCSQRFQTRRRAEDARRVLCAAIQASVLAFRVYVFSDSCGIEAAEMPLRQRRVA